MALAICDAIVDDSDFEELCFDETCSAPLDMLFVHLLPKGEHSYLMLGYDKRHVSRRLMMLLKKWKKVLVHDTDFRTLYDILSIHAYHYKCTFSIHIVAQYENVSK